MKPIMLASRGRVPAVTPLMNRMYAMPIWMMPRKDTEIQSRGTMVGAAVMPEGRVRIARRRLP
jgi:hypothetical protein